MMVVLHFQVGLNLYVILKQALQDLGLSPTTTVVPPFEGEHLQ